MAENTRIRQFTVAAPIQVWAGDLTYAWTTEGCLYLAVILDLSSRLVIGWAMGQRLTGELAEQVLTTYGMRSSMSRKANCWDNACVESFFGTLKRELVHHRHDATREAARQDIFKYIEAFYNRSRRHSTLGYDSPVEFEVRTAVA